MPAASVILNSAAGSDTKDKVCRAIQAVFAESGFSADFVTAGSGPEIYQAAHRLLLEGSSPIVAAGGDGTVSTVAAAIAGTGVPLGVLPLGTLNHFAKDLQIPLDPSSAAKVIVRGQMRRIDVGDVNGRVFINNSSLGLYPTIVQERQKLQRRGRKKWPAFLCAGATALRRYPFLTVRMEADGRALTRRTPFVFIGNNVYNMQGLQIGGRSSLSSGVLCLYVTHRTGRLGLLRLSARALLHRLGQARDFDMLVARDVWIETHRSPIAVALDGEVEWMESPLHYRVRPSALAVLAPLT
jgi:diacylglycerol kinase family enzyme